MKKIFSDNYVNYEAELIDNRGKKRVFVIRSISASMIDGIQPICQMHDDVKTMKERIKITEKIAAMITGKPAFIFRRYSYMLLWDFIKDFFDHVKRLDKQDPTGDAVK